MTAFFTGLVALAKTISELVPVMQGLVRLYQEGKAKGWIKDGSSLEAALTAPRTEEQSMALAKSLFEHAPR